MTTIDARAHMLENLDQYFTDPEQIHAFINHVLLELLHVCKEFADGLAKDRVQLSFQSSEQLKEFLGELFLHLGVTIVLDENEDIFNRSSYSRNYIGKNGAFALTHMIGNVFHLEYALVKP